MYIERVDGVVWPTVVHVFQMSGSEEEARGTSWGPLGISHQGVQRPPMEPNPAPVKHTSLVAWWWAGVGVACMPITQPARGRPRAGPQTLPVFEPLVSSLTPLFLDSILPWSFVMELNFISNSWCERIAVIFKDVSMSCIHYIF